MKVNHQIQNPELSLLLPTFNEAKIIEATLAELEKELGNDFARKTEILIVDDGTDELPQRVEHVRSSLNFFNIQVLRNHPPVGKCASLTVGFMQAKAPVVGFLDVDLSTPPSFIKPAFDAIQSNQCDILIGSRYHEESTINRKKSFIKDGLRNGFKFFNQHLIFSGMRSYKDTQCGFKFFKNKVSKVLYHSLLAKDGLGDLEVLIRANLLGYHVLEQNVVWEDLRVSSRSLKRILFKEPFSLLQLFIHYRLFRVSRLRDLNKIANAYQMN